jgi:branched-chain amino acid transport system ATP-binding protein
VLTVRDMHVRYGQAVAVAGVALTVPAGSWVAVIGANGAGKSSLLRAILGLIRNDGHVEFEGHDLTPLPPWERQKHGIGFVPEGRQLFAEMTVEENLRVGGYTCTPSDLQQGIDRAYEMFPRLAERRRQTSSTLSGGEQQMLALARALMPNPRLLLIDEISWGVMPLLVKQVFERLRAFHEQGLAILQVEQNAREVLRYADHAHVMAAGQIVMSGPAREIANDERVLENYIG